LTGLVLAFCLDGDKADSGSAIFCRVRALERQ
jgi:hypothetical protein